MVNIEVNGVSYPVPSSPADQQWAAKQLAFLQALAAAVQAGAGGMPVESFGAKGDGVTNDGPAIQRGLDAAFALSLPLAFRGVTYITRQELSNAGCAMIGQIGAAPSIIQAGVGSALNSVMKVEGVCDVKDMQFWGAHEASHCLDLHLSSYSRFQNVRCYQGNLDGFHLSSGGGYGNDSVIFRDCIAELCGTIYRSSGRAVPSSGAQKVVVPGTIATSNGSKILTGTGTLFTAMGLRKGDFISVGANGATGMWFQVETVDSDTQITTGHLQPATATLSGQAYAAFKGDGYHEDVSNENNNNRLEHFLARNNAGSGVVLRGLWSASLQTLQLDACGAFPISVGVGNTVAPICVRISDVYCETFSEIAPYAIFVANANGLAIDTIKAGVPTLYIPNPALGAGLRYNEQDNAGIYMSPVGDETNLVPNRIVLSPKDEPASGVLNTSQGTVWVDENAKIVYLKIKLSNGVTVQNVQLGSYT